MLVSRTPRTDGWEEVSMTSFPPSLHLHRAVCPVQACKDKLKMLNKSITYVQLYFKVLIIALIKADFHRYTWRKQMIFNIQEHYWEAGRMRIPVRGGMRIMPQATLFWESAEIILQK